MFGLFGAILAAAWMRGGAIALGGDAYASDLAICGILLALGAGAAIGARWSAGTRSRWWPYFAAFGIGGGAMSAFLPQLASLFQGLHHEMGGGSGAAAATLAAWMLLALVPWAGGGVAFARMSTGSDGQIVTPLALGGALGILLLDRFLGPAIGGALPLFLASLGMPALAVGLDGPPPLIQRKQDDMTRPLLFAGLTGALLGLAGKSGFLLLLQFFPASQQEIGWMQALLLTGVALGALGFGNPAALSQRPMLWTWLFVALAGVSLGVSLAIANFLQDPGNFRYYFAAFRASEGSALQGFLLFVAMGTLPSLALGAALRTLADPSAKPGRPSIAASTSAIGLGLAVGIAIATGSLIPSSGIVSCFKIALVLLIGLGALGVLLVGEAGKPEKGLGVGVCTLGIAFLLPVLPHHIEVKNAYAPGTLAVRERVEGRDGIAQATLEPGRLTELWWNHNPLGSGDEPIEKLEIALTALIAQGPDRALCMNAASPSRWEWLRGAGISHLDLCPPSPLLGELALRLEHPKTTGSTVFRAPAGIPRSYPLIVAFPEPLWPANASSLWTESTFAALRGKLTENGCFVLWLRPRECSASALRQIARAFAEAFPSAEAVLAFSGLQGPSFALVGRHRPIENPFAPGSRTEQVLKEIRNRPAFATLPIARVEEVGRFQIAQRERILEASAGASRNWGPFPQIAWDLRPRFRPEQQSEGINFLLALATRASSVPADGMPDSVATLRLVLMGFLERLRNQSPQEGWISSLEEGPISAAEMQRFLEALESNPHFPPTLQLWDAIGERALRSGSAALAAPFFEKACQRAPHRGSLFFWHGRTLMEAGLAEASVPPFQKSAEMEPSAASRWHHLGKALRKMGNLRDAVKSLERARALEAGNATNLAELALCYHGLGDSSRAREALGSARAIAPEDPAVQEAAEKLR